MLTLDSGRQEPGVPCVRESSGYMLSVMRGLHLVWSKASLEQCNALLSRIEARQRCIGTLGDNALDLVLLFSISGYKNVMSHYVHLSLNIVKWQK